ncbi:hypothetical protein P4O66_003831 [Electrophorus voltai]|uniref:ribonuclease H n=1 Tax=Electrophorus voltai TaxID=2609070 RepID=A0AAD8ZSL7_9TELE|nr:hypothetical protein P4O66_003831 [Electrophorus voltai]
MQLPPHQEWDCAITIKEGAVPPRCRIYLLSQEEERTMVQYIKEALQQGYIHPTTSPESASVFFVKKKDGELLVQYPYPLPLVPAALEQLRGAWWFTKLDLRSAYKLIRVREGHEWKTAFSTSSSHYEYLVLAYDLATAPSVFQAYINDVLWEFLGRSAVAYIDNILMYSPSWDQHVHDIQAVLGTLLQNHLYCKLETCEFYRREVSFLGYVICEGSVRMQPCKVEAVMSWPRPRNRRELQCFLGFANFYHRFINSFSTLARPLTDLLCGPSKRIKWNSEVEKSFAELKAAFSTALVLQQPDPSKPFVVEIDASNVGVGVVLSQHKGEARQLKPTAYFSKKLSPAERNYGMGDRELLAMKLAFEEWRHWLEGA